MARTFEQVQQAFMRIALWKARGGQDLIEYALMAAALAVAAGAVFPTTIVPAVSIVFSKVLLTFSKQPS